MPATWGKSQVSKLCSAPPYSKVKRTSQAKQRNVTVKGHTSRRKCTWCKTKGLYAQVCSQIPRGEKGISSLKQTSIPAAFLSMIQEFSANLSSEFSEKVVSELCGHALQVMWRLDAMMRWKKLHEASCLHPSIASLCPCQIACHRGSGTRQVSIVHQSSNSLKCASPKFSTAWGPSQACTVSVWSPPRCPFCWASHAARPFLPLWTVIVKKLKKTADQDAISLVKVPIDRCAEIVSVQKPSKDVKICVNFNACQCLYHLMGTIYPFNCGRNAWAPRSGNRAFKKAISF